MSVQDPDNKTRIHQIISLLDLTNLNDDCDQSAIEALCAQATTPVGDVAAVCVWPKFVSDARTCLGKSSTVQIATVVNFPLGNDAPQVVHTAIDKALSDGATEIDYVQPYTSLINGNTDQVRDAIRSVRKLIPESEKFKVILETGELGSQSQIQSASEIAIGEGADFIKTSTGKVPVNATLEAAAVMMEVIAKTDRNIGFKAAGGIRKVDEAINYLNLADECMGAGWADAAHFRFGASSLLQDALMKLDLAVPSGASPNKSGEY